MVRKICAGGTIYFRATTNVTGMEEVTTPAGTFRTFMIERHERGIRMGGDAGRGEGRLAGRLLYTYSYSPSTQSIVKYSLLTGQRGTREIELISFKTNRSFK